MPTETARSYNGYWGKARPATSEGAQYHLLSYHCLDVAAVGRTYLQRHPPLLGWLARRVGVADSAMLDWLTYWIMLHDLGKFATSFQNQRPDLLEMLQARVSPKAYVGLRHDSLGELLWRTHLLTVADVHEVGAEASSLRPWLAPWVQAVTGHHGEPPNSGNTNPHAHFDASDKDAAARFAYATTEFASPADVLRTLRRLPAGEAGRIARECSWWVAGITVLADWLGSNTAFFPYKTQPQDLSCYWRERALPNAMRALAAAGVLPQPPARGLSLRRIFAPDRIPVATPLQAWADSAVIDNGPKLYLLEDVTGAGKTEAALTLAYRVMAAGQADGLFIGLPTMATADAMFDRVAAAARCLFDPTAQPSVVLSHGKRDLSARFCAAVLPADRAESDASQSDETASARCAAWLADNNKKALLASVGVGTIDQALLAILHARHQSLRLLGLFRKVLIVDEVHACDDYMRRLLKALLEFHATAGGSAILVSATMTSQTKAELISAFAGARNWIATLPKSTAYPLVTCCDERGLMEHPIGTRPEVQRRVVVTYVSQPAEVFAGIRDAVGAGRCVAWVRNTVTDAIDAWQDLRAACPTMDVTLFHARFALGDRLRIENDLLERFGPTSGPAVRRARVVIATQVVEQSLDVDFDLLISDLAPIDRLIQRAGRLQRHSRRQDGARWLGSDGRGGARMLVYGPPWNDDPPADWLSAFFPRGVYVYPNPGQIWRTARELIQRGGFAMPEDARSLIETVFDDNASIPSALESGSNAALGQAIAADNMAFAAQLKLASGYSRGQVGAWMTDDASPALGSEDGWDLATTTRMGEESVTVRIARWSDGRCEPWCEGQQPWDLSTVRVLARKIREPVVDSTHAASLDSVRALLPDEGKWSVLLPFAQDDAGSWYAESLDRRGRRQRWTYDAVAGLREAAYDDGAVRDGDTP